MGLFRHYTGGECTGEKDGEKLADRRQFVQQIRRQKRFARPCGYNVNDIVSGIHRDNRFGFEEIVYLLLFGELPDVAELQSFKELLVRYRTLPQNFVRDVILKAPSDDMMNSIARSVLTLFCYDKNANDTSINNVLRQCVQLISVFPLLSVYGYHAYNHYMRDKSLYIHYAEPTMSTAEVILSLLRPDRKYTDLEAKVLDMALILHMEHGGGNNSTFTTHVVTSSGTDTYAAISAALASLKGPKHGGANVKVFEMFEDLKKNVRDWTDDDAITSYLEKLLDREAFDHKGLIYGMGHAVYTISDPRQKILKGAVHTLAHVEGFSKDFDLYERVERLAPIVIGKKTRSGKNRLVPVHPDVQPIVDAQLAKNGNTVFCMDSGKAMTANYFREFIFKPLIKELNNNPHL